jgi:predicted MFS family arabinose efflux permease
VAITAADAETPLDGAPSPPGRGRILLLALACGVAVANIYFPQAITPLIARSLHVTPGATTLIATAAQLGYAAGIFLLVPLGDRLRHRGLVVTLMLLTGAGLGAAALAPNLTLLIASSAAVGITTIVPQILLPMTAGLVSPEQRGAVTGTLLSGLLAGVLLARTFSGIFGAWLGWRAPYCICAVLAVLLALAMTRAIPATAPTSRENYRSLLVTALRLIRTQPALRRSCLNQATMFAGFTAAWTTLPLLVTGPHLRLSTAAVGLIALAGAGSVLIAPYAGRYTDRRGPDPLNRYCFTLAIAAAAILLTATSAGRATGLPALIAGMLLLDTAIQSGQVANQARIFALAPEYRSRLNTVYMTCAFLGGSTGSWLGTLAYQHFHWPGVCTLVAALALVPLLWNLSARTTAVHCAG